MSTAKGKGLDGVVSLSGVGCCWLALGRELREDKGQKIKKWERDEKRKKSNVVIKPNGKQIRCVACSHSPKFFVLFFPCSFFTDMLQV